MNKIRVIFHQFTMKQDVIVYNDNKVIEKFSVNLSDVINFVDGIKNKYDVNEINLVGNAIFVSNYRDKFQNKFNNNNIKINSIFGNQ